MAWNDNLPEDSPAYGIVTSTSNRIRVLAGPGAGKSYAMKRRVARLLEAEHVAADKILAVTFTRVAAEDLHRELVSLGVPGANALRGRTLHSLAMSILMRNHVLPMLGRVPRPLNEFELEPLLYDLNAAHGTKHQRKRLMLAYGAAWARLQTEEPGFARTPADQAFVDELVAWLITHEAMLMDEVVPHLFDYLKGNPGAQERTEFSYLLVDEFQDLNRAEQDALLFLADDASMCIIGDDDQSIYSFRHAHPEGIREWANLHPTDEHAIAECRRCPTTVVRMANALIVHNPNRLGGQMQERPDNGPGQVTVRQYPTATAEAGAVAAKIARLIEAGVAPRDVIVLTQRGKIARPIFDRLRALNIPTKSYYAEAALDTLLAQERFALLKLMLNNEDRVALRWLLGVGHDTWLTNPYRRVLHHVRQTNLSPWEAMTALASGELAIPHTGALVERFREIRGQLNALALAPDLDQFIAAWLPDDDSTALLAEAVAGCKEGVDTPQALFDSLYDAITQPEIPLEVAEVRIMSLHKSKGLSSPYVFIVGCVEGLLPTKPDADQPQAVRDAKLQEDRRLFYVGITRVKAISQATPGYLALTYSQSMPAADAFANQIAPVRVTRAGIAILQPSRFLNEMAPHLPAPQFNVPL